MEHVIVNFHQWFYNIILTWLDMIQVKQILRVASAVKMDTLDRLDTYLAVRLNSQYTLHIVHEHKIYYS